jgi:hypothetical protein
MAGKTHFDERRKARQCDIDLALSLSSEVRATLCACLTERLRARENKRQDQTGPDHTCQAPSGTTEGSSRPICKRFPTREVDAPRKQKVTVPAAESGPDAIILGESAQPPLPCLLWCDYLQE